MPRTSCAIFFSGLAAREPETSFVLAQLGAHAALKQSFYDPENPAPAMHQACVAAMLAATEVQAAASQGKRRAGLP